MSKAQTGKKNTKANVIGIYLYYKGVTEESLKDMSPKERLSARVAYADDSLEKCRQEFIALCEEVGGVGEVMGLFARAFGDYVKHKPDETTIYRAQQLQAKPAMMAMLTLTLRGEVEKLRKERKK